MPDDLFRFYLLRCPYTKSNKSSSTAAGALNLASKGWTRPRLNQLMQWVSSYFLGSDGQLNLTYYASGAVNESLEKQGLTLEEPDIAPCRASIAINNKLSIDESGRCKLRLTETYATCLFRHIRNSLAHGNFKPLENSYIALFDCSTKPNSENKRYTFGMLTTIAFLYELKKLLESEPPKDFLKGKEQKLSILNEHRISLSKKVELEDPED